MKAKPVKVSVGIALALVWSAMLAQHAAGQTLSLEGVWAAKRYFGPAVEGQLDVVQTNSKWSGRIAQFEVPLQIEGDRVLLQLPDGQGRFEGHWETGRSSIRGHWIQPPNVNSGSNYTSPLVLRQTSKNRWSGNVVPLKDEWTVYLVINRQPDGSMTAFIRNPDRNMGLFWYLNRLEKDGNKVKLIGKWLNKGEERVFGEGVYYPEEKRLSVYFASRGGTYDFSMVGDDEGPGFYSLGKNPHAFEYQPPVADGDGWKVGTLDEVGISAEPLADLVQRLNAPPTSVHDLDIHGILIARHGKLVFEEYFHGFHRMKPHETRSGSKVVAATLVGAAKLDPSTYVYDLLYKGKLPDGIDPRKKEMKLEHLLTMSSGYNCNDWDPPRPGGEEGLEDQPNRNYYDFTLKLPMESRPGELPAYCSINPNLIGAVLTAATNQKVSELFQDLVAEPLQIQRYHLQLQPTGEVYLGGGSYFLPRDYMKFAQMMLDGGMWNGKRILSKDFALRASSSLVKIPGQKNGVKYGYLWWTREYQYKGRTIVGYYASGNGGQISMAIPELDLVIAAFGGNYTDRGGSVMVGELIPKYVLPAVK